MQDRHPHADGRSEEHRHDHNLKAAYLHVLADALTSLLAIVALAGGAPVQLTDGGNNYRPRWSPDSTRIAFISTRGDSTQVWTMTADGKIQRQITTLATEADGVTDAWFTFETKVSRGRGHLRLKGDKAWTLLTTMVGLVGNILLGLQLTRLDRYADQLVADCQRAGLTIAAHTND